MVQILGTKKPAIAVLLHVHVTVHKHPLPCPWSIYGLADDFVQCFAHTDFKMLFWFRVYSTLSEFSIALETMRWPKNRKHMSWSQHFWKAIWKELEHVLVLLVVGLLKPYVGKWCNLTTASDYGNIFELGSNHQLALGPVVMSTKCLIKKINGMPAIVYWPSLKQSPLRIDAWFRWFISFRVNLALFSMAQLLLVSSYG